MNRILHIQKSINLLLYKTNQQMSANKKSLQSPSDPDDFKQLYYQQLAQIEQMKSRELEYQRRIIAMQKFIENEKLEGSFNTFLSQNMSNINSFLEKDSAPPDRRSNPYLSSFDSRDVYQKKQVSIGSLRDIDQSVINKPLRHYVGNLGGNQSLLGQTSSRVHLMPPTSAQASTIQHHQLETQQSIVSNNFFGEEAIQMIMGSQIKQQSSEEKKIMEQNDDVPLVLQTSLDFRETNEVDDNMSDLDENSPDEQNHSVISLSHIMNQVGLKEQAKKPSISSSANAPRKMELRVESQKEKMMELTPEKFQQKAPINGLLIQGKQSRNKLMKQSATTRALNVEKSPLQSALGVFQDVFGIQRSSQAQGKSKNPLSSQRDVNTRSHQSFLQNSRLPVDGFMSQKKQQPNDSYKAQRPYLSRKNSGQMSVNSYRSGSRYLQDSKSKTTRKSEQQLKIMSAKMPQRNDYKTSRSFYASPTQKADLLGYGANRVPQQLKIKLPPSHHTTEKQKELLKVPPKIRIIETKQGFIDETNKSDSDDGSNQINNYYTGQQMPKVPNEDPSDMSIRLNGSIMKPSPSRNSKKVAYNSSGIPSIIMPYKLKNQMNNFVGSKIVHEQVKENLFENTKVVKKKTFQPKQDSTNIMFGVQENEDYKEGDENVRESNIMQPDNLNEIQSNNYVRMSIETNTLKVQSRLSTQKSQISEDLTSLKQRQMQLFISSSEQYKIEKQRTANTQMEKNSKTEERKSKRDKEHRKEANKRDRYSNKLLEDSDSDINDRDDQEATNKMMDQIFQKNFITNRADVDSDVESRTSADQQLNPGSIIQNQARKQYLSKSEVVSRENNSHLAPNKFVIDMNQIEKNAEKKLVNVESQKIIQGRQINQQNNLNYEDHVKPLDDIIKGQMNTLTEQNKQQLIEFSAGFNPYDFSKSGDRARAGTLHQAKSNGNFLLNQNKNPDYRNDMLASVVNFKLDPKQLSQNHRSAKNLKFKKSQGKFSILRNSVQTAENNENSKDDYEYSLHRQSAIDTLNKQLSKDNLMPFGDGSLTLIKEDDENGTQHLESSGHLYRNIHDESININSFKVSNATKNTEFQGNFKKGEEQSPLPDSQKQELMINTGVKSPRKQGFYMEQQPQDQESESPGLQYMIQKEMSDSVQSITFGQSGKLKDELLGTDIQQLLKDNQKQYEQSGEQRLFNQDYIQRADKISERRSRGLKHYNNTLLIPDSSLVHSKLDFLPNRHSIDVDNFEKLKQKLNQKYQAKIMEYARFKKQKPVRLFEQFYTVGLIGEDLEQKSQKKEPTPQDASITIEQCFEDENLPLSNEGYLQAKKIYRYPDSANNKDIETRSKVIQDWVFPNGVKYTKIDNIMSDTTQKFFEKMLCEWTDNRENTYVFTMCENFESQEDVETPEGDEQNLDDVQKSENGIDNYFNCLCVKYKTIIERPSDGQLFLVDQAFCFLSRNNFFIPQFEFIDKLLQVINTHKKIFQTNNQYKNNNKILAENFMLVDYANEQNYISVKELYGIKLQYRRKIKDTQRFANQFPLGFMMEAEVKINGRPGVDEIAMDFEYTFPVDVRECYSFGFDWHVPLVLSIFKDVRLILKLLTALILERSTIFVSEDPVKLSSVILGLNTMMKPLEWSFGLIPILSDNLLEYLDAPQAILVGITQETYEKLSQMEDLDQDFIESKTWVYLDHFDNKNKRYLNPMSQYGQKQPDMDTTHNQYIPIDWCQGEEQPSFDEYNWYKEYPKLDQLQYKLEQFLESQTDLDALVYQLSDEQQKIFGQFSDLFNEMISCQILQYINLQKIRMENHRINEHNKINPKGQGNYIDENERMSLMQQIILKECDTLQEELKEVDFEKSLLQIPLSDSRDCSLAFLNRMSIMSTTHKKVSMDFDKNDAQKLQEDFEFLLGDSNDVRPFLKSLIETQSFQQLIQDLVKRTM